MSDRELDLEAGRRLFVEVTGRDADDQWTGLSDVGRTSWSMRAAGELRFIPSQAIPHRATVKVINPPPAPEHPATIITANETIWGTVMPGGAKQVVKLAEAEGWNVAVSYCRGPWSMQAEHADEDGDDVLTKHGQADSVLVRGWKGDRSFAAMWLRKPWTKAGQKEASSQGAGGYQLEYAQVRPAPGLLTPGSGGSKLGADGKSHPEPTDLMVLANGKVANNDLKKFIRGEEISA
jgi:hypothetical protein